MDIEKAIVVFTAYLGLPLLGKDGKPLSTRPDMSETVFKEAIYFGLQHLKKSANVKSVVVSVVEPVKPVVEPVKPVVIAPPVVK